MSDPMTGSTAATVSDGSPSDGYVVGVDVGGTKVAALVVDASGRPLARAVRPMLDRGPSDGVDVIAAAVLAAVTEAGGPARLGAIGVGVPGRIDATTGSVRLATNLDWRDLPLAARLGEAFGVRCAVENDVRLAAAGLLGLEVARGARSMAYLAVGTGIGAGLVLDGRLYRGPRGTAGEIGHVIVQPDGEPCSCGQQGCLETVASGPSIARHAADEVARGANTSLAALDTISAKDVYDAARDGDAVALRITRQAGAYLARQIGALVLTCDLERVLIGGGVAGAGAVFLDPIVAELDRQRARSALLAELLPAEAVELLPPDFDAVAWGGVALARRVLSASQAGRGADGAARPDHVEEEVVAREAMS